jgi:hypothetical protein
MERYIVRTISRCGHVVARLTVRYYDLRGEADESVHGRREK